jgi:hypothetical protein
MKRLLPVVPVVFILFFTGACRNEKTALRKMIVSECITSGIPQFQNPEAQARLREYCECSAEQISEKISRKEFMKMKEGGDEAEMKAKLLPIIQPCVEEMQHKIPAIDTAKH